MEQKIGSSKGGVGVHEEVHHYGRNASVAITIFVLLVGSWFVITGRFGVMRKAEVAPAAQELPATSTHAALEVQPPTEQFVVTDIEKTVGSQTENIATADTSIFKKPENFKSFDYDAKAGKIISLSGNCRDTYYTVLVFSSAVDYRKDPTAALSNRAFECPASKLFNVEMNLKDINLPSGNYYVFIADQGSKGSWYNPR